MRRRKALYGIGSIGVGTLVGCGGGSVAAPDDPRPMPSPTPQAPPFHTMVGAGDIGRRGLPGAEMTARLLDGIGGTVFTTGDHAYPTGKREDFLTAYEPFWGRHRSRTRPCPGNHEYETDRARPYYDYFGDAAGPAGDGYYDYTVGSWLVLSLNSEVRSDPGSAQYEWVRTKLSAMPATGIVAYWHRPLFSSGKNGPNPGLRHLWTLMHKYRVDVILNGHDHWYERFTLQNAEGVRDASGPRQFTVGTGGAELYPEGRVLTTSEVRIAGQYGVLRLDLGDGRYRWEFIGAGGGVLDSGEEACR